MKSKLLLLSLICVFASGRAAAQDEFIPDAGQEKAAKAEPQKTDAEKKDDDAIKKYEDLLKDAVKSSGPFVFYIKKKDVYLELDPSQLGKLWIIQGSFRTGAAPQGVTSGWPINRDFQAVDVFRFERKDDDIWLYSPNLYWRWQKTDPQAVAAQRSFPEAVLDTYRIEAEHPKTKKILIKVNQLFYGDLFNLTETVMQSLSRPYQLDREKTRITSIKGFPENDVISVDLYYSSPRGGGMGQAMPGLFGPQGTSHLADDRSLPIQVTYLMYPRKDSDYMPRIADPRVGYFNQQYFDHAKFTEEDRTVQLINRWNLKKKDPTAPVSEPVKPIVWYVDDSIPAKYRGAVKEGILRWNKAFDKLGYKNAVQVQEIPKGETWDHSDMRHNVVRMHNSENAGYAIALLRTDPITGEILNASVNLDNNIIWYAYREYDAYAAPAGASYSDALAKLVRPTTKPAPAPQKPAGWSEAIMCMGPEMIESAEFGLQSLRLLNFGTKVSVDQYINQFISDVVSHEIGHCMGLRHNFVASTQISLNQLADDAYTSANGNSASVMDYVPVNIAAVGKGSGNYYSNSIGSYDIFAIEYGYADVPGKTPESQLPALQKIAAKQSLPGNAFQTDEQADSFDPYITRFDLASDPLDAGDMTIKVAKRLMSVADKWYPYNGKPYTELVRAINISLRQSFQEVMNATRFVGGIIERRNFSGDPDEKPTAEPINPNTQRKALSLIAAQMFSEKAFQFSDKVLLNLTGDYKQGEFSDAPLKDLISAMQRSALSNLLSADVVSRVSNNAFKMQNRKDRFTVAELYGTIAAKVFSEVGTDRPVVSLRRELQRFMLEGMILQMLSAPGQVDEDARMVSRDLLTRLNARFGAAKSTDPMTAAHYRDCKTRIQTALDAIAVRR